MSGMLTRPKHEDVRRLGDVRAAWCVTVYGSADDWSRGNHLSPGAGSQLRAVADELRRAGATPDVVEGIRARLEELARHASDEPGQHDPYARAVGVFATPDDLESYVLTTAPAPWVGVGDRFLIGPLLEGVLGLHPPVVILALSEAEVRLIDVSARPITTLDVPGLPRDFEDALRLDLRHDRQTLSHLRTSEDPKGRLLQYARMIDEAIEPILRREGSLLVIAAAEPLASIYRTATRYPLVAASTITGNHDGDSPFELADLAAPAIEQNRRAEVEAQLARFAEHPARGLVVAELGETLERAREGAIDTLFVDVDQRRPIDAETSFGPATIDLVDEVVKGALAGNATIVPVHAADLPTFDPVAAVLRYATRSTEPAVPRGGN
jgi:hypothetical protein